MSYILDALRKAERDRGVAKVPTLATVHHQTALPSPRRLWPWIAGVVVLANAAALAWLMSPTRAPEVAVRPAPESTRSTHAPVTPPAQPAQTARAEPDKAVADVQPESDRRRPASDPRAEEATRPPADVRHGEATRPTAGPVHSEADIQSAAAAEAEADTPPPSVAPSRPAPAVRPSPGRGARSAGPVVQKTTAMPSAAAAEIRAKLSLQLVVYSETPSARIVFINNQKFVEGQSIDGAVTVERIIPDGVVLISQGERITLRAEGAGRP